MAEVGEMLPDGGQLQDELEAGGLDSGPGGRRVPQRTCIVTRVVQPPEAMIRFVRGPDGAVVPDLRAKLPGRGAWISAKRDAVATAVRKNLFARAFKGPAQAGPDLPDRIVTGLREDLRQAIAMANKAGCVVAGFSKVEAAIGGQPGAVALIHAAEASPDGRRKIAAALGSIWSEMRTLTVIELAPWPNRAMARGLRYQPYRRSRRTRCAGPPAHRDTRRYHTPRPLSRAVRQRP